MDVLRLGFLRHFWPGNLTNLSCMGVDPLFFVCFLLLWAGFLFHGPYISRSSSLFVFVFSDLSQGKLSSSVWEAQFCDFIAVAFGMGSLNRKEFVINERLTP